MTADTELKTRILRCALRLARKQGYTRITRDEVAAATQCGMGTVNHHFVDMQGLRLAVIRYAIEREDLRVLAQGLALHDPAALAAPEALRIAALKSLSA